MPTLSALYVYPIKSCGGIALDDATLNATGLAYDRHWLVADPSGAMFTQRALPRMALISTAFDGDHLAIDAPGMPTLRTPLDATPLLHAPRLDTTVWRDTMSALDAGDAAAHWFSAFLGVSARLMRFEPRVERIVDPAYTGDDRATTCFADGYPLLVIGEASLDELNTRLAKKGAPALGMDRFRPNLVLAGLEAFEEDYADRIGIATQTRGVEERVELRVVKACARCPIPTIDQRLGAPDPDWPYEPTDTLSTFRADPRRDGAVTFGQNAIVMRGAGATIARGQTLEIEIAFGD